MQFANGVKLFFGLGIMLVTSLDDICEAFSVGCAAYPNVSQNPVIDHLKAESIRRNSAFAITFHCAGSIDFLQSRHTYTKR